MITHVVAFRWKPDIAAGHVAALGVALDQLPAAIPEIAGYVHGPDLGLAGSANFDYAIAATFADLAAYQAYDAHGAHEAVRAELIRPWIAERAAVQFAH